MPRSFRLGTGQKSYLAAGGISAPPSRRNRMPFADIVIESSCRNSAVPLLDTKGSWERPSPGQVPSFESGVEIGRAVIMMGAIPQHRASVGAGTMIDMGAVLGGRAAVGARCHIGAGAVLARVIRPASATPVVVEDEVLIGANAVVIEGCRIGGAQSLRRARSSSRTYRPTPWLPDAPRVSSSVRMRPPPPRRRAGGRPAGTLRPQAHDIQTRTRKGFRYANALHP